MKKTFLAVITALAVLLALTATAERKIWMYSHDGNHLSMDVTMLDSISFEEPGVLKLDPESKSLTATGGRFTVTVTTNKAWTARVSDATVLTLSAYRGTGNGTIYVDASANTDSKAYTATVTVTLDGGVSKYVYVTVAGTTPTPAGEKCKASDYQQVTIGTQVWMAENYRCSKYDTESEAYNASWLTNNTVPTSEKFTYTPYYTDASDKSKWTYDDYAGYLTDTQVKKLGYLYNWAAAVGVADGQKQTTAFSGNRQGICPNGWHVPSRAEWQTLYDYYKDKSLTSNELGKYLKTTSGWYKNGNGSDTYGFAALPVGRANGSSVNDVGYKTGFWTATSYEGASYSAYYRALDYASDGLLGINNGKVNGQSVRCLRDSESPAPTETLSITPIEKEVSYNGEQFTINVTSNTEWKASSSKSWATLTASSGSGNGTITVTVSENTSIKADTAVVMLTTAVGKTASMSIIRLRVEKCKASDYQQVTIGTQVWMAENYRCSKYDTESEAYNASWLTNNTIPTSENRICTPYYTDASDKSKWNNDSKTRYGKNLTETQVNKLGYLYNWDAAVGVADGLEQTTAFKSRRQGICPNGWHVPSRAEWQTLKDYIEKAEGEGSYTAGKHLKTTSGWYSGSGLDSYGFAALPAGDANGSSVNSVGYNAKYWLSDTFNSDKAYYRSLNSSNDKFSESYNYKSYAYSVRCLRN